MKLIFPNLVFFSLINIISSFSFSSLLKMNLYENSLQHEADLVLILENSSFLTGKDVIAKNEDNYSFTTSISAINTLNPERLGKLMLEECNGRKLIIVINVRNESSLCSALENVSEAFRTTTTGKYLMSYNTIFLINVNRGSDELLNQIDGDDIPLLIKKNCSTNWNFPVYSDVYIFENNGIQEMNDHFYELYKLNGIHHIKYHNTSNYPNDYYYNFLPKRRGNFNGTTVRAIAVDDPEYQFQCMMEWRNGTVVSASGLCGEIITSLAFSLNFTYEIIPGTNWIEEGENGTLLGMGQQLMNDEADLAISYSTILKYRLKHLYFLQQGRDTSVSCFFTQPEANNSRLHLTPFSNSVWICLLLIWMLIIGTFKIIGIFTPVTNPDNEIEDDNYNDNSHNNFTFDLDEILLWTTAIVSQQGWYSQPKSISLRIVVLFSLLLGIISYISYSASLVSHLSSKEEVIKTIDDLVVNNFRITSDSNVQYIGHLVKSIYDRNNGFDISKASTTTMTISAAIKEMMENIKNPNLAFITITDGFRTVFHSLNYTGSNYCENIRDLPVTNKLDAALAMNKRSPYKELFELNVILTREAGISARWLNQIRVKELSPCSAQISITSSMKELGLGDFIIPFAILICGFFLSLLQFVVEKVWKGKISKSEDIIGFK